MASRKPASEGKVRGAEHVPELWPWAAIAAQQAIQHATVVRNFMAHIYARGLERVPAFQGWGANQMHPQVAVGNNEKHGYDRT